MEMFVFQIRSRCSRSVLSREACGERYSGYSVFKETVELDGVLIYSHVGCSTWRVRIKYYFQLPYVDCVTVDDGWVREE